MLEALKTGYKITYTEEGHTTEIFTEPINFREQSVSNALHIKVLCVTENLQHYVYYSCRVSRIDGKKYV